MREEQLDRLTYPKTNISDPYYLQYHFLFRDLREAIQIWGRGDVLDIGCGNKPYRPFFSGEVTSYIGCDVIQSDQNLVDIICLATDIPLEDNTKDTVLCTQVIEHVADHQKLLAEAFRILKPGGTLILSGPMCWEHHEQPYDFFRFTRYGFEYLLNKTGFEIQHIRSNGGQWAMVGQIFLNSLRFSMEKRSGWRRLLRVFYVVFQVKRVTNLFFGWLDRVDKNEIATTNFVVVAKKPG